MKYSSPEAKVQLKTRNQSTAGDNVKTRVEISKGAMIAIGTAPVLVGLWAAACFVGGIISSGGAFAFVKSWFMAVAGM